MKWIQVTAFSVIVVCLLAGCRSTQLASVPLEQVEAPVDESSLPPSALEALQTAADGRALSAFERENRGLYVAYEAEWIEDGVEAEATVLADGALLESERELRPDEYTSLPPAVLRKVRELEQRGFRVEVGRRAFYLFDIDATPALNADAERTTEQEFLLRPDGTDATR